MGQGAPWAGSGYGTHPYYIIYLWDITLAQPSRYICEILRSDNTVVAIRVLEKKNVTEELSLCLGRSAQSSDASLYERFLIIHTIHTALERKLEILTIAQNALAPHLTSDLQDMMD